MGTNRSIYVLFAISAALLAWLGNTYIVQNREQLKYTVQVEHAYQVIITLHNCENLVLDAETKQRGYLLTGDQHFRDASGISVVKIDSVLNSLGQITSDNPKQRVNVQLLRLAIAQRLAVLQQNYNLAAENRLRTERLDIGRLLTEKIHLYVQVMEDEENGLLVERNLAKNHYQSLNFTFVKYAFLFASLFCGVAVLLLIRELRKRIKIQKMLEKSLLDLLPMTYRNPCERSEHLVRSSQKNMVLLLARPKMIFYYVLTGRQKKCRV
jgi:CHASE3 domain sensor protein